MWKERQFPHCPTFSPGAAWVAKCGKSDRPALSWPTRLGATDAENRDARASELPHFWCNTFFGSIEQVPSSGSAYQRQSGTSWGVLHRVAILKVKRLLFWCFQGRLWSTCKLKLPPPCHVPQGSFLRCRSVPYAPPPSCTVTHMLHTFWCSVSKRGGRTCVTVWCFSTARADIASPTAWGIDPLSNPYPPPSKRRLLGSSLSKLGRTEHTQQLYCEPWAHCICGFVPQRLCPKAIHSRTARGKILQLQRHKSWALHCWHSHGMDHLDMEEPWELCGLEFESEASIRPSYLAWNWSKYCKLWIPRWVKSKPKKYRNTQAKLGRSQMSGALTSRCIHRAFLNCIFAQMKARRTRTLCFRFGFEIPDILLPDIDDEPMGSQNSRALHWDKTSSKG